MKDEQIRDFFHNNTPMTSDTGTYMAELSARMDAVSQIKEIHDATIRKYHRISIITFISGCLLGVALCAFLILHPISLPEFSTDIFMIFALIAGAVVTILSLALYRMYAGQSPIL